MTNTMLAEERERCGGEVDADLRSVFRPLLGALPKELLGKIIPAKRTVMRRRVSRGGRGTAATVRPAAMVKAKQGQRMTGPACIKIEHQKITGLASRLEGMMSWCSITARTYSMLFSRQT